MSTSDQPAQGPLTRKQLRELRLTGSTPVITPDEAAAAAEAAAAPADPTPEESAAAPQQAASEREDTGETRLTRRQVRERIRTASVPVVDGEQIQGEQSESADETAEKDAAASDVVPDHTSPVDESVVTAVPVFAPPAPSGAQDASSEDEVEEELTVLPVSAAASVDSVGVVPLVPASVEPEEGPSDEAETDAQDEEDPVAAVAALGIEVETRPETDEDDAAEDDVLADVDEADDVVVPDGERPTVNSAFGSGVLGSDPEPQKPFAPSFDELLTVGDSTGSHRAPNTLIFTPGPGEGSLSGPVASTGEILVTGSYELPKGLGSQGHAHGTTDGKDVDAVLIDGELPPASSPTPIAASSAISTIKPAGEVIRPPAPEKGNRLMIILAIVAGGLALAVGVAVVIAITTNVF
ncbi:hypothetical protein AUC47_05585 [Microbacterium sp. SZ1]|uniref:hypothetical protein n=1 Tax=Microbacterium sp. SZ1 TaxID=1849736 RepID=UPI000BBBFD14|nr:hypothetical protein [Microbacterium sp. SZ1]PCE14110.1 hypothetical protein AUC47_05585 [Microbacterium sp. SZ1]